MPYLERISLSQEKMNIHFYSLAIPSKQCPFMTLWSSEENCRKSEQGIQWLDGLSISISTSLPFLKCPSWGKTGLRAMLWVSWEQPIILPQGLNIAHSHKASFPISEVGCLSQDEFLLLLMGAVGLPSVCTWTTFLSSPGFSKEYV